MTESGAVKAPDYIVEMRHITKRFPGIVANDDVTMQIKGGEIFALLGENGAGKSTLMSMLFGMSEPDGGEILIRGQSVKMNSSHDAAALGIGMVHQHFNLVPNYTVAENIILGAEPMKKNFGVLPQVDIKTASKQIRALSEKYGLEVDPLKKIQDLPVSAQQRVEILKMLYRDAEILIFDEPTAVLTPQEIEYLLEIMEGLRSSGKTIILITHKLAEIKKIADRCAILCRGKLITVLDVATASTKEMASLMVGREIDLNLNKRPPSFGKTILSVKNLTVRGNEGFELVRNVSFDLRGGEIFAIAGVAGNGQVEIADAIAGLERIHSGSVTLNDKDISGYSIMERVLSGLSYIPEDRQKYGLVLDFSLSDNLALRNFHKSGFSRKGLLLPDGFSRHSQTLIEKFDIRSNLGGKTNTRSMSGGNQQKAIVAREIALDTSLIIFVQPTRGLDIGAIDNIHRHILAQRDAGKAILLISLELDEVMALADTIGVIYNGELLKIAEAGTLSANEVGKYMMGVTT